jgi:flagellar FliL protein
MVDLARELDDEDEDKAAGALAKRKSSLLKIILIVLGVLVLIGGAVGATLYFTGSHLLAGAASSAPADQKDTPGANGKGENKEAIYFAIDPPFVVNFADQNQMRFLQVTMEVMAYDPDVIDAVKKHLPVIRNNLVMLLSSQDAKTLFSLQGKQGLRQQCLEEIQKVIKERTGKKGVEDVYFTSFVMQ